MKRILPLVFILGAGVPAWQAPARAQTTPATSLSPTIVKGLPQTVKVKSGSLAVLHSKATTEVSFDWDERIVADGQLYEDTAKKTLVLTSPLAATYRVTATWFEASKGKFKEIWYVQFDGGPPVPPGPGPGPDPPKPPPIDGLAKQLRDAFKADFDAGKAKQAEFRNVGLIFGEAGKFLGLATTTSDVLKLLSLALDTAVTDGHMPTVKGIVAGRLATVAPKNVPIDFGIKTAFDKLFAELAKAIEEAQK